MKASVYFFIGFISMFSSITSYSQCTVALYGQWPTTTFSPTDCNGQPEVISSACYAGEFSVVLVENANEYVFSSNVNTDYLTIVKASDNTVLAYGTTPVSLTPNFSGEIYFYTHVSSGCEEEEFERDRIVSCSVPVPCLNAPIYDQYPQSVFFPSVCDGTTAEVIATDCYAGEYSKVSLTTAQTYVFSSSTLSDYITISDEDGITGIISGFSPLTYESTTDQVVRFYVHTDNACGEEDVNRSRIVTCSAQTLCTNGYIWPEETYVPTCGGTVETIASDTYAGEYSLVTMQAGEAYTLGSSVSTDYLTVTSEDGNTLIMRGVTPLTVTPVASANYRFYLHTDIFCGEEFVDRTRTISCSSAVGISELNEMPWSVYPNPASNQVTISADVAIEELQLVSVDGKVMLTLHPANPTTTISLENYQAGTYFIRLTQQGLVQTKELIKQ